MMYNYYDVLNFLQFERDAHIVRWNKNQIIFKHTEWLVEMINFYNMECYLRWKDDELYITIGRDELEKVDISGGSI